MTPLMQPYGGGPDRGGAREETLREERMTHGGGRMERRMNSGILSEERLPVEGRIISEEQISIGSLGDLASLVNTDTDDLLFLDPSSTSSSSPLLHSTTMNGTSSDDYYDYDIEDSWNTFYWDELLPPLTVYVLTLLLGVIGNALIIYTISRFNGMKSTTNVFLASLASADLLLILICVPVKTAKVFAYSWTFGWFMCKAIHYLQNVSAICSVLTLTAMSLERYYAILFPFRAKYILTVHQAQRMTGLVWGLSLLLAIPILHVQVHTRVGVRFNAYWCHPNWDSLRVWQGYEVYMLLVVLVVPTLVMAFAYSAIGCKLTKVMVERSTLVGSPHVISSRSRNDDRDVKQIVTMLFVVVVLFICCWSPLLVTNVLRAWGFLPAYHHNPFYKHLYNTVHLLAYFNSCINPIVYGFLSKNFRESFYAALCPCIRPPRPPIRQFSLSHTRTTSVGFKESFRLSVRYSHRATNV